MRLIGAMILGCALMVGSADASHHCETKCTPVRSPRIVTGKQHIHYTDK